MKGWAGIPGIWRSARTRGKDTWSPRRRVGEGVQGRVPCQVLEPEGETGGEVEKRLKDGRTGEVDGRRSQN